MNGCKTSWLLSICLDLVQRAAQNFRSRVEVLRFRVSGLGFRVSGLGFRF